MVPDAGPEDTACPAATPDLRPTLDLACAAEPRCTTLVGAHLVYFDPWTGQSFGTRPVDVQFPDSGVDTFALTAEEMVYCSDGHLVKARYAGGISVTETSACGLFGAITHDQTGYWSAGTHYPNLDSLVAGCPDTERTLFATRFGADDGVVVGAWHSTATLEVADLATTTTRPFPLERVDDWILGVDWLEDGSVAVLNRDAEVERFGRDGSALGVTAISELDALGIFASGLNCGVGPEFCSAAERPTETDPVSEPRCPVAFAADCELEREQGFCDGEALIVVGLYAPGTDTNEVEVLVDRDGPLTLVLTAHDSTVFNLEVPSTTELRRVVLAGSAQHEVRGLPLETQLVDRSNGAVSAFYSAPRRNPAGRIAMDELERELALPMTGFAGCYRASTVQIR